VLHELAHAAAVHGARGERVVCFCVAPWFVAVVAVSREMFTSFSSCLLAVRVVVEEHFGCLSRPLHLVQFRYGVLAQQEPSESSEKDRSDSLMYQVSLRPLSRRLSFCCARPVARAGQQLEAGSPCRRHSC
jgi:hypothetical protein